MWYNDGGTYNDKKLANALKGEIGPEVPGSDYLNYRDDLGELKRQAVYGDAYVETQFHDNQPRQQWMYNNLESLGALYGYAIDVYLGYP